jgi:hypothetical protein
MNLSYLCPKRQAINTCVGRGFVNSTARAFFSALERGVLSTPYARNRDILRLVPTDMTLGYPVLRRSPLLALKVRLPIIEKNEMGWACGAYG